MHTYTYIHTYIYYVSTYSMVSESCSISEFYIPRAKPSASGYKLTNTWLTYHAIMYLYHIALTIHMITCFLKVVAMAMWYITYIHVHTVGCTILVFVGHIAIMTICTLKGVSHSPTMELILTMSTEYKEYSHNYRYNVHLLFRRLLFGISRSFHHWTELTTIFLHVDLWALP